MRPGGRLARAESVGLPLALVVLLVALGTVAATVASVALLAAAAPVFGMSSGLDLGTRVLGERPTGQAQQVLVSQFTPGSVAPLRVVIPDGGRDPAAVAELTRALAADPRVARVDTVPAPGAPAVLVSVVTSVQTDSPQAYALVHDPRSTRGPVPPGLRVLVGGASA